jgi:drug/metabolite transporter (DMT)-like permease
MRSNLKVHLSLFAVALIYGANYVIAKGLMPNRLSPEAFIMWRTSWGALVFTLLHFVFVKEKIKRKRDFALMAVGGFFGIFLNQYMFFKGLNLGSAANASVIMTTTPIIVLFFSYFYLKEPISFKKGFGVLLGFLGAILLIVHNGISWDNDAFIGDSLVFINAASFGIFLVIMKPVMSKYQAETVIKWIFLFGWLMMLPFGFTAAMDTDYGVFTQGDWLSLGYVLIFTTTFAYLFNVKSLGKVSPSIVGYYIYLQPVLANLISISMGTDQWVWSRFFYSILIFTGVYLVSLRK